MFACLLAHKRVKAVFELATQNKKLAYEKQSAKF